MAPPAELEPRSADDWAAHAADRIESVVTSIRDKTSKPLTTVARALVYGLVAAVLGVVVVTLLAIALVRAVDELVPGDVWSAHLIVGGTFTAAGLFLWSRRGRRGGS